MFIKICGTTNLEDAQLALAMGADALGFIFAPSKRRVTPERVKEIVAFLPTGVGRVGVFTTGDAAEISAIVREAKLTAVQLHMTQNEALIQRLQAEFGEALKIWQVVCYEIEPEHTIAYEEQFVAALARSFSDERIAVTLVDSARGGTSGGLGMSFPWARVAALVRSARDVAGDPAGHSGILMIAGGLSAGNVAAAIQALRPDGVDCVSGVEAEPGRKDPDRLRSFVKATRDERRFSLATAPRETELG